jgi:hypothetical protein
MRMLLLSSRHPRYMMPLKKWGTQLRQRGWLVTERYPDVFYKEEVLKELTKCYDIIVYFGNGIPGGWCGYSLIDFTDLQKVRPSRPSHLIVNFCCYSLNRARELSLADILVSNSLAKHVAGYEGRVKYTDNLRCLNEFMRQCLRCKTLQVNKLIMKRLLPLTYVAM